MTMITGGELVVRTLLKAGVTNVFTLYGGHLETVFQGIREHAVKFLDVRHEVAAGHAAEGYARASGTLGVALVTAGPGITNVVTSITNAYLDRTPLVYISAAASLGHSEVNMVQGGFDQVAIVKPITKWAHRVTVTRDIPRLLAHALRIATTAPTGPVLIELPIDVTYALIEDATVSIPDTIRSDEPALPHPKAVTHALQLLAGAQRPVIMAGEGAWQCAAAAELLEFVNATGIPVFSDYQAHGLLPNSHPLYAGSFFKMLELTEAAQRPDVVLALGVRFGVFTLGATRLVPAAATVIHVEVDGKEVGRVRDVTLSLVADSRETLHAMNAHVGNYAWPDWHAWQQLLRDARSARVQRNIANAKQRGERIHPYAAAMAIVESLDNDAIVIADGAESHQWMAEVIDMEQPNCFFTHGHFGCLGFGLGFAMGVQVAQPRKHVVCVTGDGGVGLTIAEFDTMARHNLPIVVVIMNNRAWGATKHFQDMISGPGKNIAVDLGEACYHDVAAAFGCHAAHVTHLDQLKPALQAAIASGKPACINIEIDLADMPPDAIALTSYA